MFSRVHPCAAIVWNSSNISLTACFTVIFRICGLLDSKYRSLPPMTSGETILSAPAFLSLLMFSSLLALVTIHVSSFVSRMVNTINKLVTSSPVLIITLLHFSLANLATKSSSVAFLWITTTFSFSSANLSNI